MKRQANISDATNLNEGKAEDDPSFIKAFKTLSSDAQKLCTYNGNSLNCTVRALSTTGEDNTDWIPNNEGEEFKLFAESNGTTFGEYAAALELVPMLNLNPTDSDPFAAMDDFEWNHYWKSVYKYSGGQNKDALNNLVYPDIKKSLEESDEGEIYKNKINHLDPKNRNVPIK